MANNQVEIEVKFRLENLSVLEEKIKSAGGQLLHRDTFQRTVRMDTPDEQLENKKVFLRVRDGEKKVMTVKTKIPNTGENFKISQELEVEVSDISLVEKMLETLGFTKKLIMEKYRTEYELLGTFVALDRLPFGNYLEIEGEQGEIEKVIDILGLTDKERLVSTYWHLFDDYRKDNGLTDENIVFSSTN